jgi:glucosamine kinase
MVGEAVIGMDVGGSKAAMAVVGSDGARRDVVEPCAAWHRRGLEGVTGGVTGLIRAVGGPGGTAVVGAHGCDTTEQCRRLAAAIAAQLPSWTIVALNDAELLVPAAGVAHGLGLVCGTGSIVVGYLPDGSLLSVGGWGGYLAEEGSATGLFRDAARAVVQGHDHAAPRDPIEDILLDLLELEELRDLPAALGGMGGPTAWAHLTPVLFERALAAGSALARQVIEVSADTLADLVVLADARGCDTTTVVAGGGVVSNAPWMREALERSMVRACPDSEFVVLTSPPANGALVLARELDRLRRGDPGAIAHHPALDRFLPIAPAADETWIEMT